MNASDIVNDRTHKAGHAEAMGRRTTEGDEADIRWKVLYVERTRALEKIAKAHETRDHRSQTRLLHLHVRDRRRRYHPLVRTRPPPMNFAQAKSLLAKTLALAVAPGPMPHPRRIDLTVLGGEASDLGHALGLVTAEGLTAEELAFWEKVYLASMGRAKDSDTCARAADAAIHTRRERASKGLVP